MIKDRRTMGYYLSITSEDCDCGFDCGKFNDDYYLKEIFESKRYEAIITIKLIKEFFDKYICRLETSKLTTKEEKELTYIPRLLQLDNDMFVWTLSQFQKPYIEEGFMSIEKIDLSVIAIMARCIGGTIGLG